ncbi:ABC transporter permease [Saccharothrix obliqua]|uniref:ABC transporter permease n=1 Tax=Saccharothrix obliqua TaxID=2861747 RepID=UPI001C5EC5CB|nr:ABC transporter permease [Saccharothrix obliqua]MBW4717871.1 ABC transporter permease [Saccharothrix obliqua]
MSTWLPGGTPRTAARWFARRASLAAIVVAGAVTAAFLGLELTADDPALTVLGTTPRTPELVEQVRAELALDKPAWQRYLLMIGRVFTGDLGTSHQLQQPVWSLIGEQASASAELVVAGIAVALVVASTSAIATAGGRRPMLRAALSAVEHVTAASPAFWFGLLLLGVFSFRLHLFPVAGGTGPRALVLPALTLALELFGPFAQVLRAGLDTALREPFALTARARGTTWERLLVRHALRHALLPLVTLSGWTVGALLSGAVVIETVFGRQGLGRLLATAITGHDLPVVVGVVTVSAVAFAVVSMVVDWLYGVIDPRTGEAIG